MSRRPQRSAFQLSLRWRRRFIVLITGAAGGMVLLQLLHEGPASLRFGGTLLLGCVVAMGGWLLSDIARLWRSVDLLSPAERAVREYSIGRAYALLVWGCLAVALALQLPALAAVGIPVALQRTRILLWALVVAAITLPGIVATWSAGAPEDEGMGPARLIRDRFAGEGATAHIATLLLVLIAVGLLGLLALPPGPRVALRSGAIMVAILAVLIAGVMVGRQLMKEMRSTVPPDSSRR